MRLTGSCEIFGFGGFIKRSSTLPAIYSRAGLVPGGRNSVRHWSRGPSFVILAGSATGGSTHY